MAGGLIYGVEVLFRATVYVKAVSPVDAQAYVQGTPPGEVVTECIDLDSLQMDSVMPGREPYNSSGVRPCAVTDKASGAE